MFASASWDGLCRLWDTETGKCLQTVYLSNNPPVSSVRFTPNGRFLVVSHLDSAVRLWDINEAKWVKKYAGHANDRHCITSSVCSTPKGAPCIVSGSEDHAIYLWDVSSQQPVCKIPAAHADVVLAIACNPEAPMFASSALEKDRTIKIWKVDA